MFTAMSRFMAAVEADNRLSTGTHWTGEAPTSLPVRLMVQHRPLQSVQAKKEDQQRVHVNNLPEVL